MSVAFDHRDAGTPEGDWQRAAPWADAAAFGLAVDRVVVVAAHPDDETLGAGGLLWTAAQAGIAVSVIVATDGEGSPVAGQTPDEVAVLRRGELTAALHELAPTARLRFLGLPDGGLDRHRDALRAAIADELGEASTSAWRTLLVATWAGDGHRDHRVTGEIAAGFAAPGVQVAEYPVWLWHWGTPATVDTRGWRVLPLTPDAVAAKSRALARHRSQVEGDAPMLHDGMLAHFQRDAEVFIAREASSRPSTPTPDFEAKFEASADPWGFRTRWYERRKRTLLLASLPHERYVAALELGCANGELTAALAPRTDRLVAVDGAAAAIRRAHERLAGEEGTELQHRQLPGDWPSGRFDLVVASEIAYYWSPDHLAEAIARIDGALTDEGVVVVCHWRGAMADAAVSTDVVHAAFTTAPGWERIVQHIEPDFLLDVHARRRESASS